MLSSKLIQLVEDHWEQITRRVIGEIRRDPELAHLGQLPDSELIEWSGNIIRNLDLWLVSGRTKEIGDTYESLGRRRYQENVPLRELVRGTQTLKVVMVDFVRSQGLHQTAVDIYAEEELDYLVGRFFDMVLYHGVKGYEQELRKERAQSGVASARTAGS